MKTYLHLQKTNTAPLPPPFTSDDVRYPESLVRALLEAFTEPGQVVFDPFAGYGTTLQVAEEMGRVGFGLELSEERARFARSRLRHPERLIHGDARRLAAYDLPAFDFSITSPPYMGRNDPQDPLDAYQSPGQGYQAYLQGIRSIYQRARSLMQPTARVVIEAANLKLTGEVTPLAWDIAREVGRVLSFEGEIVVCWEPTYGFGYDHSYCLVFSAAPAAPHIDPRKTG